MTTQGVQIAGQGAQIAGSAAAQDAARDWQALRADATIQYAPVAPIKPPETPDWLKQLGEWLRSVFSPIGEALGMSWPVLEKVLIALGALLAIYVLWRLVLQPLLEARRAPRISAEPDWAPDRAQVVALLEDADRLAAEGRFSEATHLLLQRSVHHIAQARPDWLQPASTAREIAVLPMLSQSARQAFNTISARVERSLFALRELNAADWKAARAAYTDFAQAALAA